MPFQRGNKLGAKAKVFERTLRRVLHQNPNKMRSIAEKLVDMACEGNLGAIAEVRNTIDGKPTEHKIITRTDRPLSYAERLDQERALATRLLAEDPLGNTVQ